MCYESRTREKKAFWRKNKPFNFKKVQQESIKADKEKKGIRAVQNKYILCNKIKMLFAAMNRSKPEKL